MAYGAGDRGTVRKRREPRGHGPPPPNRPTLGAIPKLDAYPGAPQQARAAKRAVAAQPAPVLPHIPIIARPSPRQIEAAKRTVAAAVVREAGPGASHADRMATVERLKRDPRAAHFVRAASHYARAGERAFAARTGAAQRSAPAPVNPLGDLAAMGFEVSPQLSQRSRDIRAGRGLGAAQAQRDQAHPAFPHKRIGIGPASLDATAVQRALIGATSLNSGDLGPRQAFGKAARDAASLGTFPFVVGYQTGAGIADVALGHGTGRLQAEASGIAKSTADMVRHPLRYAGEHPLLAALTVAGGVGAAGRVAGAVSRGAGSTVTSAGMRGALARVGSTERSPLALGNDANAPLVARRTSKDTTRRAVQLSNDARREPLLDAQGKPVTQRMPSGQVLPVLKARASERPFVGSERTRLLKSEANFTTARANADERLQRDRVNHEFHVRGIKGPARDIVSMVVEGTVTSAEHFRADLVRHANRIAEHLAAEKAAPGTVFRHPGEIRSAEHRLATVKRVLASPKLMEQAPRIVAAGVDIGRRLNEKEALASRLGILDPMRANRSRLVVPAVEHLGAKHFTPDELAALGPDAGVSEQALQHGALRHPDGKFLSNAQVHNVLREKGRDPATVAYLPHRFDVRGRRAFHTQFRPGNRPIVDKPQTRTGSMYARGATSAGTDLITEQAARLVTQTVKTGHYDRLIGRMGLKHPDGRHYTGKEAMEAADRIQESTGEQLIPVRAYGAKLSNEATTIAQREQGTAAAQTLHEAMLNKRLDVGAGAKNVVLMPKPVVDQLLKHLKPAGTIEKFFQALNPAFRLAVLPQFRWLTGNFVEPYLIRLPIEGSGVTNIPGMIMDIRATQRILKTMRASDNPATRKMAEVLYAQQLGSGLFIGNRGAAVRRDLREFGKAGAAAAFFRDLPVMKQAIDVAAMLPKSFFAMNRVIESGAQKVAFGRLARREIQSFTGSWTQTVALQKQAMAELARGLTDTATQHRFMVEQHKMLGQYEGFNPAMRRMVQSVTPFVPWYLNALRFAYWTMPAHHTTLTALAAVTNQQYEKDWKAMHANVPPGSLKFAIPTKDGGWVDLARYTPYGAGTEQLGGAATWQSVVSQVAPQLQGVISALTGTDPFGRPLQVAKDAKHPQGRPISALELLPIAANQLAGSMIPGYAVAQRLREGGGTPFGNSNLLSPKTKPGSAHMGAANRTLNPIRPTYLRAPSKAPSVSSSGSAPVDRLTLLRRQAAGRKPAQSNARLLELRRAAAARRP